MQEIAQPVEDERLAGDLNAAHDMRVMADDEVDAVLLRGKAAEVGKLLGIGAHPAFLAIVDRQDAVVGRRGDEPAADLGIVVVESVGALAGFVRAGAVALEIVGDDARRRKGDFRALDADALWAARLLAVHTEAGGDGEAFVLQPADVL